MRRSSRSISLPRADRVVAPGQARGGRGGALGAGGGGGGQGDLGFALEVPPAAFDGGVEPGPDLGLFDLDPGPALAGVADGPFGGGPLPAQGAEPGGGGPGGFRPFPPLVPQPAVDAGQDFDALGDGPVDCGGGGRPPGGGAPALFGLLAGLAVADQAGFDFFEPLAQPPAALLH